MQADSKNIKIPKILVMVLNFMKAERVLLAVDDILKQEGCFEIEVVVGEILVTRSRLKFYLN